MKATMKTIIKKASVITMTLCMLTGLSHAASAKMADQKKVLNNSAKVNASKYRVIKRQGIDPAVTRLQVSKLATGRLGISATIKNIGTEDFVSGRNQAQIRLQVYNPRMSGPLAYKTLVTRNFANLPTGHSITVNAGHTLDFFKEWAENNTVTSGECLVEKQIIALITYDPDILMDGNEQNDDVQYRNNIKRHDVEYIANCPW